MANHILLAQIGTMAYIYSIVSANNVARASLTKSLPLGSQRDNFLTSLLREFFNLKKQN
jgi:hypothetical protein